MEDGSGLFLEIMFFVQGGFFKLRTTLSIFNQLSIITMWVVYAN